MIRCDTVVVNGYKVHDAEKSVVLVPPSDLNQHLGGLLLTGKGADVVFEAGGETFAAHRCVLAARSPFFSAQLFGSMKMKEGSTSKDQVRIHGIEAQVFKALLCFLYTDSLLELMKEEEGTICQHLLVAADTYSMERLKLICEDKLCKHINVGTVANILALAEARHCHVLKSACFGFLGSKANLTAVPAAMASCISKQAAPLL
jgi:speckle-type POZ protein